MQTMNMKRVIAGGIIAAAVINLSETILNVPVLGEQMAKVMEATGMRPAAPGLFAMTILWSVFTGILGIWFYALVRPTLGKGPITAMKIGVLIWFFSYLFAALMGFAEALLPNNMIWTILIWRLVEMPVAMIAGASIYKD
jgi:hypothetical protein